MPIFFTEQSTPLTKLPPYFYTTFLLRNFPLRKGKKPKEVGCWKKTNPKIKGTKVGDQSPKVGESCARFRPQTWGIDATGLRELSSTSKKAQKQRKILALPLATKIIGLGLGL